MFSVKTVQIFAGQKKKKKKKKHTHKKTNKKKKHFLSTNALNLQEYTRSNKLIALF